MKNISIDELSVVVETMPEQALVEMYESADTVAILLLMEIQVILLPMFITCTIVVRFHPIKLMSYDILKSNKLGDVYKLDNNLSENITGNFEMWKMILMV